MAELDDQLASIGATNTEHKEWRIFGPPGCGKTTHIKRQVKRAVEKYGPEAVLVTSFSKAAAAELAGRDLPIDPQQIGTLHAHCYRALGRPDLAEANVKSWNDANPRLAITPTRDNSLELPDERGLDEAADGNDLLAEVNRWRNRMMPYDMLPNHLRQFNEMWRDWKKSHHYLDYTDLLETAARNCAAAPRNPKVIFGDEAQDFTRLQLTLVRKWGQEAEYFVVVGDDDQTIYEFTGATPDAFLTPEVPPGQKIVLSQSYRVPQAIHELAVRWIARVKHREPKEYLPTSVAGKVEHIHWNWRKHAKQLVDYAQREVAAGRSVMFLGACAYMLGPVRQELITQAIPFWNPYRLKRGDWNPLRTGGNGISAGDRVQAFAIPHHSQEWSRPWTAKEFLRWAEWIEAKGIFLHGGKSAAAKLAPDTPVTMENLAAWLMPDQYETLMQSIMNGELGDHLRWWAARVMKTHTRTAYYPVRVAMNRGLKALAAPPRIILGTIHSVKGGESDTVILFPDLSWKGYHRGFEDNRQDERDAAYRQFYVGMTRARHTLAICEAEGNYGVGL